MGVTFARSSCMSHTPNWSVTSLPAGQWPAITLWLTQSYYFIKYLVLGIRRFRNNICVFTRIQHSGILRVNWMRFLSLSVAVQKFFLTINSIQIYFSHFFIVAPCMLLRLFILFQLMHNFTHFKNTKTVPGKVATTHTEDGHKQNT